LFTFSNLALHLLQQKATVLPSLPVAVMLEPAGLRLMGHLSAARALGGEQDKGGEQCFHGGSVGTCGITSLNWPENHGQAILTGVGFRSFR
jgi:hypothetical protein